MHLPQNNRFIFLRASNDIEIIELGSEDATSRHLKRH